MPPAPRRTTRSSNDLPSPALPFRLWMVSRETPAEVSHGWRLISCCRRMCSYSCIGWVAEDFKGGDQHYTRSAPFRLVADQAICLPFDGQGRLRPSPAIALITTFTQNSVVTFTGTRSRTVTVMECGAAPALFATNLRTSKIKSSSIFSSNSCFRFKNTASGED